MAVAASGTAADADRAAEIQRKQRKYILAEWEPRAGIEKARERGWILMKDIPGW